MSAPNTVTINEKKYFPAQELYHFDPLFFRGCKRSVRQLVVKRTIPEQDYLYVDKVMDDATVMDPKALKAKLLLSEAWVMANHPQLNAAVTYEYDPLPNLIILEDHEKFMDDEGNLYNVDTRGERDEDKVFFKVYDVAKVFGMDSLMSTLQHEGRGYVKDEHYKTFVLPVVLNEQDKQNADNRDGRTTYLTYEGLLKVIYSSRGNSVVHKFRKWASRIIYTAHMGTIEQRNEVATTIRRGATIQAVKDVIGCSSTSVSCVYLFCIGSAKDLYDVDGSDLVYKFGRTNDLKRRTGEHKLKYGPNIKLQQYAYIDPQHAVEAEADLKAYLKDDIKVQFMDSEVVIMDVDQSDLMKTKFKVMAEDYGGCLTELNRTINELNHQLELSKVKMDLKEAQMELKLRDKDIDIMNLRFELLSLRQSHC